MVDNLPKSAQVDPPLQWLTLLLPVCLALAKGVIELSGEGLMSCLTSSFCVLKSLPSMKMLVSLCKCSYLGDLVQCQRPGLEGLLPLVTAALIMRGGAITVVDRIPRHREVLLWQQRQQGGRGFWVPLCHLPALRASLLCPQLMPATLIVVV